MDEPDLQTLLREGIAAAKAAQAEAAPVDKSQSSRIQRIGAAKTSQRERARQLLLQVTELDETNIAAWLWLSTVLDSLDEKQVCLENVLTLAPDNKAARAGLARLEQMARSAPPKPEPSKIVPPPPEQPRLQPSPARREEKRTVSKAPQAGGILCPFCRQTISAVATTCSHCRLPLVVTCPACGTEVDVEKPACTRCGQTMGDYRHKLKYFVELATASQEQQRYEEALKAWQAVEAIKPDHPDLHLHLAQAQIGLGREDRATRSLQRALKENPNSTEVYYTLGEMLRQRGEIEEAYTHYLKVTRLDPRHGRAWLRLGQLYEQARRGKDALQAYQRAAKVLETGSAESRQVRQQLQALQPSLPEAMMTGWSELIRQMSGPVLVCLLALLLDSGLRPWWFGWSGWLGLLLAFMGAFLWVSADSLPRNPLICQLLGREGLETTGLRGPIAFFGLFCWVLAFALIIMPIGQSFPEPPNL
ncbi:MAG: tetratricopeptide repeat protein [Anaerolineae bacterium]|nr:tetratricopeptide repeat protein [Anaerolineae bacterium]